MDRFFYLLPHVLGVFGMLLALTGSTWMAIILVSGIVGLLYAYRIPQVEKSVSEKVLHLESSKPIAHRGAALDAPENTLAAVREAHKNGASAIEFDLEWTLDGRSVILHDDTVDRTTDGSGVICRMTFDSVRQLDASAKHSKRDQFPGEKVPTLEEYVQLCLSLGLKMFLDVKSNGEKTAEVLSELCKKYPKMYDMAIVCSFDPRIVYAVRKREPRFVTGMTFRKWYLSRQSIFGSRRFGSILKHYLFTVADMFLEWATFGWLWYLIGNSTFLFIKDSVSGETLDYFKDRNIHLILWTVNDPNEKKYFGETLKIPYISDSLLNDASI